MIPLIGTPAQRRVVLTFLDQGVSSLSNFATGVVVARVAGAAEFGDYMLTVMVWLFAVGLHRSLISEPLVVSMARQHDHREVVARGLTAALMVGAVLTIAVAASGLVVHASGSRVGILMVALSPWLVPLVAQDFWRAMAFQERRPGIALGNDLVYAGVQALITIVVVISGRGTTPALIAAWGAGALAGALFGFARVRTMGSWRGGMTLLRRLSQLSRWMVVDFVTGYASAQAYLAFVALLLSRVEYGGFRAAFSLMGPVLVLFLASGNIGLPEASRRSAVSDRPALRRFTRLLTGATAACVGAYTLLVVVAAGPLLAALYGQSFRRFAPLVGLAAAQYLLTVAVFGHGIALKATGRLRHLWRARVGAAVTSLVATIALVRLLGTAGAGWAGIATAGAFTIAVYLIYRSQLGPAAAADASEPTAEMIPVTS